MKNNWQTKKLGEICEVIAGQSPEGKYYNKLSNGLPFYQGKKEFTDKYIGTPTIWTTEITKEAKPGDILMSVRAPVGPVNYATERICIGRGLAAIRAGKEIDRDFLFNFLRRHESEIIGNAGAVFNSINKTQIENIEILLPPLPTQRLIVKRLDKIFAGIAKAKLNAEKNLQNSRELFESYLQGVFANPGERWKLVKLSELATDITDGDHLPPPKSSTGIPFITISNIDKNTRKIDFSKTFTVSREYYKRLKVNRKPKRGDVLYTVTGSFGIPVIVDSDLEFCFQRHIGLIRPTNHTNTKWLYYLLLSPQAFRQAYEGATGTAQKTVSLKSLRSFMVPKVSLPTQKAIVKKLDALAGKTKKLEAIYQKKLADLDELKKSVLKKAFSGEL